MPFVFESPNTMLKFFFFFLKRKTMCIIKVDYVNQHEVQQQRLVEHLPSNAKQFDYINIIFFLTSLGNQN